MKWYNLKGFYPWWTLNFRSQYPVDHIETIVEGLKDYYGEDLWEEFTVKNVEWKSEEECWMLGNYETLPTYCKVVRDGNTYYYYLYDKNEIVAENSNGLVYRGKYILDKYMTKFQKKLSILIENDPLIKFNHKYCNRFEQDSDGNWFIDFVAQKWLSSYVNTNNEKVRKIAYSTDEETLYNNNFATITKPDTITLTNYKDSSKTWEISNFSTILATPSNTGRYRYLICKSSAKISTNSSKITPVETTQTILVIPLWDNSILHAINDIDTTQTQTGALSCLGENLIGFWESDLPYSFLYGMWQSDTTNISMKFGTNTCYGTTTSANIPFFELPLNYYKKYKLIDYSQYSAGFGGKMVNMIENLDKWNPDTEPALYAPQNYSEVYNNGVGSITNDMSYFIFQWQGTSSLEHIREYRKNGTIPNDDPAFISMYCAFGFDDGLNIAYDFGDYTNTKLASYDNTEVITSNVSIQNQILGSAAANYYSSNVNTGLTSVQNRKSEQTQAWVDFALNTAKGAANLAPDGLSDALKVGKQVKKAVSFALDTAKNATDTALSQQRANRELASRVNNIYSSPATVVGNPYIKGIIPNNNILFKTYALELHDLDKTKIFSDILEFGRIYDAMDKLSAFDNNEFMNILDVNPKPTYNQLLAPILLEDTSIFNNASDNDDFFIWLGQPHQMYNVWFPINVLNYQADDYVDNVEKIAYPTIKTHINSVITNIPKHIRAYSVYALADLKEANPEAPEAVWDDITLIIDSYNHITIKTKDTSTTYYGTIIAPTICYNAMSGGHYIYNFNKVFNTLRVPEYITFEDGTKVKRATFNKPIVFNDVVNIGTIEYGFLWGFSEFNSDITLPEKVEISSTATTSLTIKGGFVHECPNMTSTIIMNGSSYLCAGDNLTCATVVKTALMYTTGVNVQGTYAEQFMTKYPNSDTSPYRKLCLKE